MWCQQVEGRYCCVIGPPGGPPGGPPVGPPGGPPGLPPGGPPQFSTNNTAAVYTYLLHIKASTC